jgi:hypothetical protein
LVTVNVRIAVPFVPDVTCPKSMGVAACGSPRTPVLSTYEIWSTSIVPAIPMPVPTSGYRFEPITSVAEACPVCPGANVTVKLTEEPAEIVAGKLEVSKANALVAKTAVWVDMAGVFNAALDWFARVIVKDDVALVGTFPKSSCVEELLGWRTPLPLGPA